MKHTNLAKSMFLAASVISGPLMLSACGGETSSTQVVNQDKPKVSTPSPSPSPSGSPSSSPSPSSSGSPSPSPSPSPSDDAMDGDEEPKDDNQDLEKGIGDLLWEDDFSSVDDSIWNINIGDGCDIGKCGWGNEELQWYKADNVTSDGDNLVLTPKRENVNEGIPRAFTSGKVDTKDKLSIQYGMIEFRMSVPDLEIGLWPAVWLLGTHGVWPYDGEIDMMEMGHHAGAFEMVENFSAHEPEQSATDYGVNDFVGANAINYNFDACVPGNETCAAMTAWENDNAYIAKQSLADRFVIYRLYWTPEELRFTVIDGGVEEELYDAPINIAKPKSSTAADPMYAYREPFYLLVNLAIGGSFTDASVNGEVTAPMDSGMLVDYIKVYEYDGHGEVILGEAPSRLAEKGDLGLATDTTSVDKILSTRVYSWAETLAGGDIDAKEGENVLAWEFSGATEWFGFGIHSDRVLNLSDYRDSGTIEFELNMPPGVSFQVGVKDAYNNEATISQDDLVDLGLQTGAWSKVSIPVSKFQEANANIDLGSIIIPFFISNDGAPPSNFEFAVDDVVILEN